jgi:hypothetical protein
MNQTAVNWLIEQLEKEYNSFPLLRAEDCIKAIEMEKEQNIESKIEAVNHFCKLNGFADTNMHKSVVDMYEKQMKK